MITINFSTLQSTLEFIFSILGIIAFIYIILVGYKLNRFLKKIDFMNSFKCLAGVFNVFAKKNKD